MTHPDDHLPLACNGHFSPLNVIPCFGRKGCKMKVKVMMIRVDRAGCAQREMECMNTQQFGLRWFATLLHTGIWGHKFVLELY